MEIKFDTSSKTVKPIATLICLSLILVFCAVSEVKGECPLPSPAAYCQLYFQGSVVTGSCEYSECFEMSYGDLIRVLPAHDKELFPQTWFLWGKGELDTSYYLITTELQPLSEGAEVKEGFSTQHRPAFQP